MVQAILEDRKTMTRRVVKPQPSDDGLWNDTRFPRSLQSTLQGWNGTVDSTGESKQFKCPYGQIGDVLWVRETWRPCIFGVAKYCYKVAVLNDIFKKEPPLIYVADDHKSYPWKPSIFMPKAACRLFLEITDIRVEWLQDISEADAKAEGVKAEGALTHYYWFEQLWKSINGADSWNNNPWVWVISFKRIEKPENFGV